MPMAVAPDIEQLVPVREGEYGDKVVAVEPGGIEYIRERERHGRALNLFWTWMSPNLEFATIFVGVLPVALFGMGFADAAAAIILGTALGSITHGILSAWGPRFGTPQMVQSRGAFGFLGNLLPAGLNAFTASVGWFIVNSVSGAFALQVLLGAKLLNVVDLPFGIAYLIIVVAQVAVAFIGHNMVHAFERVVFPYLALVFGLALVWIVAQAHLTTGINSGLQGPLGELGAFTLTFTAAFGYAAGWNPYASDYSRYLPRDSNPMRVGLAAGLGVFVSCVVLELVGAALVTVPGTKWGTTDNPTEQFRSVLPFALGVATMLGIAIGAVAANALNIYSGAMSFLTLGIKLPLRQRRALVALASGVVGLAIGIIYQANVGPGSKYEFFLLLISYWIAPYLAVVLLDYWLRRGAYDERVFYDRRYRPWKGIAAMLAGLIVSFPFWNNLLFKGPIPTALPWVGDLTFVVGFIVTAAVYYALQPRPAHSSRRAS